MTAWTNDEPTRIGTADELQIGTPRSPHPGRRHRQDVLLVETDDLIDQIDAAYGTKYRRYAANIIDTIVSPQARAATLRLVPTAPWFNRVRPQLPPESPGKAPDTFCGCRR